MTRDRVIFLLAVAVVLFAFGTCRDESTPAEVPALSSPNEVSGAFAGSARCVSCHQDEHNAWSASPHAKQDEPRGAPPKEADLFIGSVWMQAYMQRDAYGYHRILPTCYDLREKRVTDVERVLAAIRGERMPEDPDQGPSRLATRSFETDCAGCHASGTKLQFDLPTARLAATWRATHIDCEACHGPGRAHAEAWERLDPNVPMPQLDRLSPRASVAVCARCHGGPAAHGGLDPADAEHYLCTPRGFEQLYSNGMSTGQSYQAGAFLRSPCHTEGGLTCVDCHDAHDNRFRHVETADAMCTRCHEAQSGYAHTHHPEDSEGARCVACHMPRVLTGLLAHQRDHRIGNPLPAAREAPDACTACHTDQSKTWAANWSRTWWGPPPRATLRAIKAVHTLRTKGLAAAAPDLDAAVDHPDPFFRWVAAEALQRYEAAVDDPVPEVRLYAALSIQDPAKHRDVLTRLLEDAHPLVRSAAAVRSLRTTSEMAARREDYLLAARMIARTPDVRYALASLALLDGSPSEAAWWFESIAALHSGAHQAWGGLVGALGMARRTKDAQGAIRLWEREGLDEQRITGVVSSLLAAGHVELAAHMLMELSTYHEGRPLYWAINNMLSRMAQTYRGRPR